MGEPLLSSNCTQTHSLSLAIECSILIIVSKVARYVDRVLQPMVATPRSAGFLWVISMNLFPFSCL